MKIHVQKTVEAETASAVEELLLGLRQQLEGATPDLAFLFVTHHHEEHFPTLSAQIQQGLGCRHLIGCSCEAVLAGDEELENTPGIVIWSLSQTQAEIKPFHLEFQREGDHIECYGQPGEATPGPEQGAIFLFCEPYSSSPQLAIAELAESQTGLPVFGGVASGGIGPGESCLFLDGAKIDHGAIGIVYRSERKIRQIVSQGCRPIGHTFIVTKAEKNVLFELGGLPAMQQFREMFQDLSAEDQELVRHGPHLGVVTNEYKEQFERGDFLVSNVLGSDPETGAIAVSQAVRVGKTVQFHVRDAVTADEDLQLMIEQDKRHHQTGVIGGLLFTCNGRGARLFEAPHHDATLLQDAYGPFPLAGFFAQGEIGPLADRSYLHGFTASIALFEA